MFRNIFVESLAEWEVNLLIGTIGFACINGAFQKPKVLKHAPVNLRHLLLQFCVVRSQNVRANNGGRCCTTLLP